MNSWIVYETFKYEASTYAEKNYDRTKKQIQFSCQEFASFVITYEACM